MASGMQTVPSRETLASIPTGTREDAQYTPRQLEMTDRWNFYRAEEYAACEYDWGGRKRTRPHETDFIARQGYVPNGFVDVNGATKSLDELPSRFRHPVAPYRIVRSVIRRFTSLLFGSRKHPAIEVADDWQTSDYVQGLLEVTRFWNAWIQARNRGGATGSACIVFTIVEGRPVLEVLDPRWVTPTYSDPRTRELACLEVRYPFTVTEMVKGKPKEVAYVYRRVITTEVDTVFVPLRADDKYAEWTEIEAQGAHGYGFVPGVWLGNTEPTDGGYDGDPDCLGLYDLAKEIDALMSTSSIGVKASCDPTVVIATDLDLDKIQKGAKYAIKVDKGGAVSYLEASGSGATAARDQALMLRRQFLESARCVIDNPDQAEATATEVDKRYQAMHDHLDEVREQYAEEGIKPLATKLVAAIRIHAERGEAVYVPPKVETGDDGETIIARPRELGHGELVVVKWPGWTKPSAQDAGVAASATATALGAKAIDRQTAITYLAPMFGGEDPAEIERRILADDAASMDAEANRMLAAMPPPSSDGAAPKGSELTFEDLKADLFSVNEYRHAKGIAPMTGADVTWSEWEARKAANQQPNAAATALAAPQMTAIVAIVTAVAAGTLPRDSGVAILLASLPLSQDQANAIIPPEPIAPVAPPPMLGGPPMGPPHPGGPPGAPPPHPGPPAPPHAPPGPPDPGAL